MTTVIGLLVLFWWKLIKMAQVEDNIANITRSFEFNVVFEPEASQTEVFEHSGVKRLIDMALDGFVVSVPMNSPGFYCSFISI